MKEKKIKFISMGLTIIYCSFLLSYFILPKSSRYPLSTFPEIYYPISGHLKLWPLIAIFRGVNHPYGIRSIRLEVSRIKDGKTELVEILDSSNFKGIIDHFSNLDTVYFLDQLQSPLMHIFRYSENVNYILDNKTFDPKGIYKYKIKSLNQSFKTWMLLKNDAIVTRRYCESIGKGEKININVNILYYHFEESKVSFKEVKGNYYQYECNEKTL